MTGKSKADIRTAASPLRTTPSAFLMKNSCNIPGWRNKNSAREVREEKVTEEGGHVRSTTFMVQCHRHVPRKLCVVTSCKTASHISRACFSFLYGLHEKRPPPPAVLQYAMGDPHKTVQRNTSPSICAYCLNTYRMSHHAECHRCTVGASTPSVGAALPYNVWDASSFSRRSNLQPPQSLSVNERSVMPARWHAEARCNMLCEMFLYVMNCVSAVPCVTDHGTARDARF